MVGKWVISGNHIAIDTGSDILHPDAAEIYEFIVGEGDETNLKVRNPLEELSDLTFSKIGSSIQGELNTDDNGEILFELYSQRKKRKCPVDIVNGHIIDQAVSDREWFYINTDIEDLQMIIDDAGIEASGIITIGQYIKIIKNIYSLGTKEITNNVSNLTSFEPATITESLPVMLNADLYEYQKTGYLWMKYMHDAGCGCILGDEMGLGKTLQVITLFVHMKQSRQVPVLVISPVSLLDNWKIECSKFAPSLDVYIHHGKGRTGRYQELKAHDVIIISYNTAVSDLAMLKMINWECVALDEAQNIKNPYSARAKAVKSISRKGSVAITGTPFENHITDIWSLVDFCEPGLLGTLHNFKEHVEDNLSGAEVIEPILSSIMIRRLVDDVAKDLPDKVIIPQAIAMSDEETKQYESIRQTAINEMGEGSPISLGLLQKLRMFCTHPSLLADDASVDPARESIKYQRLCELVDEIVAKNEKVIIFTSYKKMFEVLFRDAANRFGVPIDFINGDTPVEDRQKKVEWFNEYDGSAILALNPHAAGTGLNITGANHVIHYNLEWNPAVEDQASARAYRRGQTRTVFIYRLYYINTVEQVVNERIEHKREIASVAVVGNAGMNDERADIIRALELAPEIQGKENR